MAKHTDHDDWAAATAAGPEAQILLLLDWMVDDDTYAESTTTRTGRILASLGARLDRIGHAGLHELTAKDASAFVMARTLRGGHPSLATMHLRRSTLRLAHGVLSDRIALSCPDPTSALHLAPKQRVGCRPLTAEELSLVRIAASTRRGSAGLVVALVEAGATTGEVPVVTWGDIDLAAGRLRLPGAGRVLPRDVSLSPWGVRTVRNHAQRRRDLDDRVRVAYRGRAEVPSDTAQAGITTRVRGLLTRAGITDDDVHPRSLRTCLPAARLHHDRRIDIAARTLGLQSLDIAAAHCCWNWQER